MRGKVHQTLDAQALCVLCEQLLLLVQAGMPSHSSTSFEARSASAVVTVSTVSTT